MDDERLAAYRTRYPNWAWLFRDARDVITFEEGSRRAHMSTDEFYIMLESKYVKFSYRFNHRKLPGSNRTSRLRKKRRTMIRELAITLRRASN